MDEMISLLEEIRDLLSEMNDKIGELRDEVSSVKGSGIYDTISDVCDKLDSLDATISLK